MLGKPRGGAQAAKTGEREVAGRSIFYRLGWYDTTVEKNLKWN